MQGCGLVVVRLETVQLFERLSGRDAQAREQRDLFIRGMALTARAEVLKCRVNRGYFFRIQGTGIRAFHHEAKYL
jgi:hypothetical protein